MSQIYFIIVSFSFLFGIGLASFLPFVFFKPFLFFVLFLSLALGFVFVSNKKAKLALLGLAVFFLAFWRYSLSFPVFDSSSIENYLGQTVIARAVIVKEPDWRPEQQNLFVKIKQVKPLSGQRQSWRPAHGQVLIIMKKYPTYKYGDEIEFKARLQAPQPFNGFAYDRYLARFGVYTICYYPQTKLLARNQASYLRALLFSFKQGWRDILRRGLPSPEAELAQAILIGDKHAPAKKWRQVFSRAGLSHIMAISGMHISILAVIMINFFIWAGLARRQAFWLISGLLWLYIFLIGAPASAARAGIVGMLVLFGLAFGRLANSLNLLAVAAIGLLFVNPRLLRDDIGFQLSFLAVAGIILFYPILSNWLENFWLTKRWPAAWRSILAITVCAQLTTWPLVAYNFKIVSIVSVLANLAVVWSLPFVLVSLLLASLISSLATGVSIWAFAPSFWLLWLIKKVALFFAAFKFGFLPTQTFSWVWVMVWYGLLGIGYGIMRKKYAAC
jgi:competence protein ComEC